VKATGRANHTQHTTRTRVAHGTVLNTFRSLEATIREPSRDCSSGCGWVRGGSGGEEGASEKVACEAESTTTQTTTTRTNHPAATHTQHYTQPQLKRHARSHVFIFLCDISMAAFLVKAERWSYPQHHTFQRTNAPTRQCSTLEGLPRRRYAAANDSERGERPRRPREVLAGGAELKSLLFERANRTDLRAQRAHLFAKEARDAHSYKRTTRRDAR
jgi:hypothetical protein